jgi:hypothetical protein
VRAPHAGRLSRAPHAGRTAGPALDFEVAVRSRVGRRRPLSSIVESVVATGGRGWVALVRSALGVAILSSCSSQVLKTPPFVDVSTSQPPAEATYPRCPRDGAGLGVGHMSKGQGWLLEPCPVTSTLRTYSGAASMATLSRYPAVFGTR